MCKDNTSGCSGSGINSPLPDASYDFWRGDLDLIQPTPSSLDEEVRGICRRFVLADDALRIRFRQSARLDQFYMLIAFAKRSAVIGVRQSDPGVIADGLCGIAMIDHERVDRRDIIWCLALLYHTANKVGGAADKMFREAAEMADSEVAAMFTDFADHAPPHVSLRDDWGFDEVQTDDGFGFIGWGFSEYNPTLDLKSAILDIAHLVSSVDYQPSHVEVAAELPAVWLRGSDSSQLQRILADVRGGASLSADLRPAKHAEHAVQQFTVFLVEAANASDAESLCQMARSKAGMEHCKLAVAESRLFCLVVARSFVDGLVAYETSESLERFGDGLAAILESYADH